MGSGIELSFHSTIMTRGIINPAAPARISFQSNARIKLGRANTNRIGRIKRLVSAPHIESPASNVNRKRCFGFGDFINVKSARILEFISRGDK